MSRLGMVIDLQRCVGCGACALACKAEHNTRTRGNGQSYNYADFLMRTEGTFPKTTQWVMPVLCNHCADAPCVKACPQNPTAFKTPEGITMHDPDRCIGCQLCHACVEACPAKARIFGDQEDPASEISKVLKANKSFRLKEDKGTRPNVHYVGKYSARA